MTDDETKKFRERILADIARDNQQIVRLDDPVMVLPTMLRIILDKLLEEQKNALLEFRSGLYQTQKKISEDALATAKTTVLGAMSGINDLVKNKVSEEMNTGCKKIRDVVKSEAQECFSAYGKEFVELKHSGESITAAAKLAFYAALVAFLGGISAVVATVIR
jgi:hypothetical protein